MANGSRLEIIHLVVMEQKGTLEMNDKRLLCFTLIAMSTVLFGNLLQAQTILEEVVVTAQKREQSLQEVPISITAFNKEQIKDNMFTDVADYFEASPNVAFSANRNRANRDISIRGISNLGGDTAESFGFYIDEFNVAAATNNPQINDIERIEILRGPQGTYFGRNATGGAISLVTSKPGNEFYAEGTAGVGEFDTYETEGVVNVPIVKDKLAARFSGRWTKTDGFVKNVNASGGGEQSEYWNMRAALRFTPSDELTVDLTALVMRETDEQENGIATHVGLDPTTAQFTAGVGGFPVTDGLNPFPTNQTTVNRDIAQNQRNEYEIYIGRVNYDFERFSLTSITGFIDQTNHDLGDIDATSLNFVIRDGGTTTESFSQEVRLSSLGDGNRIDWTLGGIYAEDSLSVDSTFSAGTDAIVFNPFVPGCNPANFPTCLAPLPPGFILFNDQIAIDTDSWAIFADATWHVNDKLDLTVGGRYSEDEVKRQQTAINFGAPRDFGTGKVSFNDFSPRFTANYAWSDDVNLYATVSKGYKAGGLQLEILPSGTLFPAEFDEENMWNYEVGMKGLFMDGRLRAGLSVFYMDWKDVQVTTRQQLVDPGTGNFVVLEVTENAAAATSAGVEFDFDARLSDAFTLSGSVGYLDSEFDNFANSSVEDSFGNTPDLSGSEMLMAPKWTLNLVGEYSRPVFTNYEGFLRAEFNYKDKMRPKISGRIDSLVRNDPFVDGSSGTPFETPDYATVNLRAGIENDKYSLVGYVENVFDKLYWTGGYDNVYFSGIHILPNPRTFGVRFSINTN